MPIPPTKFGCPSCGSTELGTIERLYGVADFAAINTDGYPEWTGRTEVDWDSSTTVGATCGNCHWWYEGDDWTHQLVEVF